MKLKIEKTAAKKIGTSMLGAMLVMAFFFTWQNCARVDLVKMPSLKEMKSTGITASICPQIQSQGMTSGNFLFVVDMSSSNIGGWFNVGAFWYFDPKKATDATGARFDAITYFLNNCGQQPNAKFAVVGFSDGAGQVSGSGKTAALNCTGVKFGSAADAQAQINALKQVQTAESSWYLQWSQSTNNYLTSTADQPPIVRATSYTNALKCADQVVVGDLTQANGATADTYQVVFISDGSPADEKNVGCNQAGSTAAQQASCYTDNIDQYTSTMRQSALAMGRDLRIYGIFYGQAEAGVPAAMSRVALDGGTNVPMDLTSFAGNQDALCKMVGAQLNVNFKPDSFTVVNLTSINKNGVVLADSDMDGLSDDDEIRLGYDPLNPRSLVSGVLDGICEKLGGASKCQERRNQISCDSNRFFNLLTECDLKILGIDTAATTQTPGVDTDKDTIVDYLEIVKGLDPKSGDAGSDPDGDGVYNQQEVMQGTDPFTPDLQFPQSQRNLFSTVFDPNLSICSAGGWNLNVSQVQTSPTKNFSGWPGFSQVDLSHASQGQVLWLGYRMVPMNGSNQSVTYYWKIVKTQILDANSGQQPTSGPNFQDTDFSNLGSMSP